MRRLLLPVMGLSILLTAGCQGTNYFPEKKLIIEKDAPYYETEFRGPKSDQKVTVRAGSDSPFSVYLTLMDDKHEAIVALRSGKKPRKTLAGEETTKDATIEATVPAGRAFVVLLKAAEKGKEIEVKLDVQGK